jgi:hypothetical protein
MTIFCDMCETEVIIDSTAEAERQGWVIAEDEPDAINRHGLCPTCADQE